MISEDLPPTSETTPDNLDSESNQAIKEGGRILTLNASNAVANTLEGLVKSGVTEREGGQILILSPETGSAAALSALPSELSSESKGSENDGEKQEGEGRKSLAFQTMYKKKKGTDSSDGLMHNASTITSKTTSDNLNSESKDSENDGEKQEGEGLKDGEITPDDKPDSPITKDSKGEEKAKKDEGFNKKSRLSQQS